jgi:hypothetical protein
MRTGLPGLAVAAALLAGAPTASAADDPNPRANCVGWMHSNPTETGAAGALHSRLKGNTLISEVATAIDPRIRQIESGVISPDNGICFVERVP